MNKSIDITAIILAGGKSKRMARDKALIKLGEKTFLELVIDAVKPLVHDIMIISSNEDHDRFNYKRYNDLYLNIGPLAGIYTGLYHSKTDWNFVLSCDVPYLTKDILNRLIVASGDFQVIQFEADQHTTPLVALYHKNCEKEILNMIQKGEKRVQYAVSQLRFKTISLDEKDWKYMMNINSPDDLKKLK